MVLVLVPLVWWWVSRRLSSTGLTDSSDADQAMIDRERAAAQAVAAASAERECECRRQCELVRQMEMKAAAREQDAATKLLPHKPQPKCAPHEPQPNKPQLSEFPSLSLCVSKSLLFDRRACYFYWKELRGLMRLRLMSSCLGLSPVVMQTFC
jgi:hypothetical protein